MAIGKGDLKASVGFGTWEEVSDQASGQAGEVFGSRGKKDEERVIEESARPRRRDCNRGSIVIDRPIRIHDGGIKYDIERIPRFRQTERCKISRHRLLRCMPVTNSAAGEGGGGVERKERKHRRGSHLRISLLLSDLQCSESRHDYTKGGLDGE